MSTTGKRYIQRTRDKQATRVLDSSTKAVLNAVLSERRGESLRAYLLARGVVIRG
jgi:outer membrane protein OmpA-like peptidoglycan-associated protein